MAENSQIEWTDATWQPITGCTIVSPGCTNCYAMKLAGGRLRNLKSRKGLTTKSKAGPVWNGQIRFNEEWLTQPLTWRKPKRIFVCAHGDLFHESVPDAWIDKVFAVMALTPQHTYQVLTKRAERMREYASKPRTVHRIYSLICDLVTNGVCDGVLIAPGIDPTLAPPGRRIFLDTWPLPNVWLGVSTERQQEADERIPLLLQTPAAIRFISAEPLLGPIDLMSIAIMRDHPQKMFPDWVIVGGESGPRARPMHPQWPRELRDQCAAAGVPFFFKQWGSWKDGSDFAADGSVKAVLRDGRVVDPDLKSMQEADRINAVACQAPSLMRNVGKHAAGRLLDGVEHNAVPG